MIPSPAAQRPLILVGTASWQEQGFIDDWYPPGLPKTRLLSWYAEHFSYVEVNGTFYGIPRANVVRKWCEQTPEGFVFDVKLHRLLSRHATESKFLPPELRPRAALSGQKVLLTSKMEKLVAHQFRAGIEPLVAAGKLGSLLLQLSPSFSPRTHPLTEIDHVLGLFQDFPIAVELRNRGWLEGEQQRDTVEFFTRRRITLVSVDAPVSTHFTIMPNADFITQPKLAYFRAHGRNERAYLTGKTVQERFNYDYPEKELIEFAQRVTGIASKVEAVHVVFNNNRSNFAPKAAQKFLDILAKRHPGFDVRRPQKPQPALL